MILPGLDDMILLACLLLPLSQLWGDIPYVTTPTSCQPASNPLDTLSQSSRTC